MGRGNLLPTNIKDDDYRMVYLFMPSFADSESIDEDWYDWRVNLLEVIDSALPKGFYRYTERYRPIFEYFQDATVAICLEEEDAYMAIIVRPRHELEWDELDEDDVYDRVYNVAEELFKVIDQAFPGDLYVRDGVWTCRRYNP